MSAPTCPDGFCYLDAGHTGPCVEPEAPKGHHPSWTPRVQRAFCASLGTLGWSYTDAAAYCEHLGQPRPSGQPQARRNALLSWLATSPERAVTWREERRSAERRAA